MDALGAGVIQSSNGFAIKPLDLTPDMISIEDIAHTLSLKNRFGGRTLVPFSVAQHCVIVSHIYPSIHALLHDAAEAFFDDFPSPIKKYIYMMLPSSVQCIPTPFAQVESRTMGVIYKALGLEWPLDGRTVELIHQADMISLVTEKRDLMAKCDLVWREMGVQPMPKTIQPWSWRGSKRAFLRRFRELMLPQPEKTSVAS